MTPGPFQDAASARAAAADYRPVKMIDTREPAGRAPRRRRATEPLQ